MKQAQTPGKKEGEGYTAVAVAALVALLVLIGWVQSSLDHAGYLSHSREASITAAASWIVGESKACSTALNARGNVSNSVICDDGPVHQIKVEFHGRLQRPDEKDRYAVDWKCFRRSESFECYALN